MQTQNQKTHKDEPCEESVCDMCNTETVFVGEVNTHNEDLQRNREVAQPYYKRIGLKV